MSILMAQEILEFRGLPFHTYILQSDDNNYSAGKRLRNASSPFQATLTKRPSLQAMRYARHLSGDLGS
jgi:hypothetical protein